ncbi:WG repeat-containing protein [Clostridium drakei]|uniref:WG repeat-containing protein n=1 Tax=Clostridium drakei TaxID=332101 RepID=A0A2U8DVT1_9CLOT|nr:WG repeat-containing protein [Clostridium drakei]AWI06740.1 hypothetical protein B9W14_20315 [Clostridium drakei]
MIESLGEILSSRFRIIYEGEDYFSRKYGLVNMKGEEILPCIYDCIYNFDFYNNMLTLEIGEKYGCATSEGKIVVPVEYDYIQMHKCVVAAKKDNKYGFFNLSGELIIPFEYVDYIECENILYMDDKETYYYGVINPNIDEVTYIQESDIVMCEDGIILAKLGDKYIYYHGCEQMMI